MSAVQKENTKPQDPGFWNIDEINPLTKAQQQFEDADLYSDVDAALDTVAKKYRITPLFAGIFGSRAKDYAGPQSDWDLYVVYQGPLIQYVKALNVKTHQQRSEEVLPPQITIEAGADNASRIQLNFVSLDFFAGQIGSCNIDFRMALDNRVWFNDKRARDPIACAPITRLAILLTHLEKLARISYDGEKLKHEGMGRASKVIKALQKGEALPTSELTDGLYRMLMAWSATRPEVLDIHVRNMTQTLESLTVSYLNIEGRLDFQMTTLRTQMIPEIQSGKWLEHLDKWQGGLLRILDKLMTVTKPRPAVNLPPIPADQAIAERLELADALNQLFVKMLLEGGK